MNGLTRSTRLGALVAGSAALLAFAVSGPAQAGDIKTKGGANQDGIYSSVEGETAPALGNGKGHGKAVGRPAAGSVGNADDKNPPGQLPEGAVNPDLPMTELDSNSGYECDENAGVGQGNPAHSGCGLTDNASS